MKKMNARLEWKGRKLLCNGVCVAEVEHLDLPTSWKKPQWQARFFEDGNAQCADEAAARQAVNRRFGLKE